MLGALRGGVAFYAHAVEVAIQIEDDALIVTITGTRSAGQPDTTSVLIPQALPYRIMKLHAFEDRRVKGQPDKERQHALNLYAVVGMMTEAEYERAKELGTAHVGNEHVGRARTIVRDPFASRTGGRILRLREHPLFREDFLLNDFMGVLREIFPSG